jgi:hypothetical protein
MSTLVTGTIKSNTTNPPLFQNTSGTEIGTLCRAWVNFNGTGTVAIRASYNVSSITDNGTGDYTVNFATALADTNYSAVISNSGPVNQNHTPPFLGQPGGNDGAAFSTTSLRISSYVTTNSGLRADPLQFCVTIFR